MVINFKKVCPSFLPASLFLLFSVAPAFSLERENPELVYGCALGDEIGENGCTPLADLYGGLGNGWKPFGKYVTSDGTIYKGNMWKDLLSCLLKAGVYSPARGTVIQTSKGSTQEFEDALCMCNELIFDESFYCSTSFSSNPFSSGTLGEIADALEDNCLVLAHSTIVAPKAKNGHTLQVVKSPDESFGSGFGIRDVNFPELTQDFIPNYRDRSIDIAGYGKGGKAFIDGYTIKCPIDWDLEVDVFAVESASTGGGAPVH
ncbi:hypothetical protein OAO01_05245 [Oligoflexia bacterium]|nr:hypothetical protein [Oligoflexia bacterium]